MPTTDSHTNANSDQVLEREMSLVSALVITRQNLGASPSWLLKILQVDSEPSKREDSTRLLQNWGALRAPSRRPPRWHPEGSYVGSTVDAQTPLRRHDAFRFGTQDSVDLKFQDSQRSSAFGAARRSVSWNSRSLEAGSPSVFWGYQTSSTNASRLAAPTLQCFMILQNVKLAHAWLPAVVSQENLVNGSSRMHHLDALVLPSSQFYAGRAAPQDNVEIQAFLARTHRHRHRPAREDWTSSSPLPASVERVRVRAPSRPLNAWTL
ncbi:hypothetical protein R3P38DRAFT_3196537 [Favolaschia claudopus]|uniref:Uncharacterized protein n=1 Tax=Favolaschia claudopus TaxID=2862362 RepID=A0AAW0B8B1_9AGAR